VLTDSVDYDKTTTKVRAESALTDMRYKVDHARVLACVPADSDDSAVWLKRR